MRARVAPGTPGPRVLSGWTDEVARAAAIVWVPRELAAEDAIRGRVQGIDIFTRFALRKLAGPESLQNDLEHEEAFDQAFAEQFSAPVPDVFNAPQQLTIVASELDPASERIVSYLSDRYAIPINAVLFRYFADGSAEYIHSPDMAATS